MRVQLTLTGAYRTHDGWALDGDNPEAFAARNGCKAGVYCQTSGNLLVMDARGWYLFKPGQFEISKGRN